MNSFKFLIPFLIIGVALFQSCGEDDKEPDPIDFGYDYFPLEIGKYIEYDVDSTIYYNGILGSGDAEVRNNSIQVREEVTDSFTDNEGNTVYRIKRFERANETEAWALNDNWTAAIMDEQAERTEAYDLRFIKMTFPVSDDTSPWNGNEYIDENIIVSVGGENISIFKHWLQYEYREIGESLNIGGFDFDDVVTIFQANENNFIEIRRSYEQYARGVGLVKREMFILDTECLEDCVGQTWEEKAEQGFTISQTVRDYN